mgnify:CR=1 FL=1
MEVTADATILDAAKLAGVSIPTLCHHPKLTPFGGCRLCLVEVKGFLKPVTACTTTVGEGMEVVTSTPELEELRRLVLELILSDHPNDCMVCEKACQLKAIDRIEIKKEGKNKPLPVVIAEKCNGCGQCEYKCPAPPAIKVYTLDNTPKRT